MPGVQMPHCAPPWSTNACCTACSRSAGREPSMVVIDAPVALRERHEAAVDELAVEQHRARAALAFAAAFLGAGEAAAPRAARRAAAPSDAPSTATAVAVDREATVASAALRHAPPPARSHQPLGRDRDRGGRRRRSRARSRWRSPAPGRPSAARRCPSRRRVRTRTATSSKMHADRRHVRRGRHDVVGHLRVGHPAFPPDDVLVERPADRLRDAAFDLAGREHRVDRPCRPPAPRRSRRRASRRCQVDRDLGDVRPPRRRRRRRRPVRLVVPRDARRRLVLRRRSQRARGART